LGRDVRRAGDGGAGADRRGVTRPLRRGRRPRARTVPPRDAARVRVLRRGVASRGGAMNGGAADVEALIERHRDEWDASTSASAFIAGARDGTLDPGAFERWLAQDRHFVDGL